MSQIAMVNFLSPDYSIEKNILSEAGFQSASYHGTSILEVIDSLQDTEILIVQLEKISCEAIQRMPRLKLIAREGIGLDSIDIAAASERGIPIMNVPDYCLEEVAVHACSLLLTAHRKLSQASRLVSTGQWSRFLDLKPIQALSELTLGLIGMGRIGAQVITRMRGFGCRIVVSDPFVKAEDLPAGVELVSLDSLLEQADLISLHCPLTEQTRHLINKTNIAKMKRKPVLVNVSRGQIVNEADLLAALDEGTIAFTGLDVLEQEPPQPDHPLLHHPRALVTNHLAWYSEQSEQRLRSLTALRVVDFLSGKPIPNIVNQRQLMG